MPATATCYGSFAASHRETSCSRTSSSFGERHPEADEVEADEFRVNPAHSSALNSSAGLFDLACYRRPYSSSAVRRRSAPSSSLLLDCHGQVQGVTIPLVAAHGWVVAPPHHPIRPKRLVRQIQERRDRLHERKRLPHRLCPIGELTQPVDSDGDVRKPRQPKDLPPRRVRRHVVRPPSGAAQVLDHDRRFGTAATSAANSSDPNVAGDPLHETERPSFAAVRQIRSGSSPGECVSVQNRAPRAPRSRSRAS